MLWCGDDDLKEKGLESSGRSICCTGIPEYKKIKQCCHYW